MAVIEICDICGKQVGYQDGVHLNYTDVRERDFLKRRTYEVRFCEKCIENIRDYVRKLKE